MTDNVSSFSLTIAGWGGPSLISRASFDLGWSNVTRILLVFPPGCAKNVFAEIEKGGAQVFPTAAGKYFAFDDYVLDIDPTSKGNAGQWALAAYNQDFYSHTLDIHLFWDYVPVAQQQPVTSLVAL